MVGIVIGILVAALLWWFLKVSVYALIVFAIVGALLGAIPLFMRRRVK